MIRIGPTKSIILTLAFALCACTHTTALNDSGPNYQIAGTHSGHVTRGLYCDSANCILTIERVGTDSVTGTLTFGPSITISTSGRSIIPKPCNVRGHILPDSTLCVWLTVGDIPDDTLIANRNPQCTLPHYWTPYMWAGKAFEYGSPGLLTDFYISIE